jgi:hypothetical protein
MIIETIIKMRRATIAKPVTRLRNTVMITHTHQLGVTMDFSRRQKIAIARAPSTAASTCGSRSKSLVITRPDAQA